MAANPEPSERDRKMALKWWRDNNTGIENLPDLLAAAREEGRREERANWETTLRDPPDALVEQWSRLTARKVWGRIDENLGEEGWNGGAAANLRNAILKDDKEILRCLALAIDLIRGNGMTTPKPSERDWIAAAQVCRDVAELTDRTSPDDNADFMLVTGDELQPMVAAALATARVEATKAAHKATEPAFRDIMTALRMIRDAVQELGPVGAVAEADTGPPNPIGEAEGVIAGIQKIADQARREAQAWRPIESAPEYGLLVLFNQDLHEYIIGQSIDWPSSTYWLPLPEPPL